MIGKTGYLVLMMQKTIQTNAMPVSMETEEIYGACFVYKTKAKARKAWGKNVAIQEIIIGGVK